MAGTVSEGTPDRRCSSGGWVICPTRTVVPKQGSSREEIPQMLSLPNLLSPVGASHWLKPPGSQSAREVGKWSPQELVAQGIEDGRRGLWE